MSQDPNHVDPIPADDAPHAYVAVQRYGSEWYSRAAVIHAQETTALADWRSQPEITLLPIVRDGDTGTRAIVEPRTITDFGEFTHLPIGTVVAGTDTGTVFERVDCGWMRMGHNIPCYHYEVFEHDKAAVVLRMGSVSDGE